MKRDMDRIRALLMRMEGVDENGLDAETPEDIYHLALLIEADLVHGATAGGSKGYPIAAHGIRLTWDGHEFLEAARSDARWRKAMAQFKDGVALPVLFEALKHLLRTGAGLPPSG